MPPKIKFSKEKIAEKALEIVRQSGIENLSARSLAEELGCSPQPIFSYFENMEEVKLKVFEMAVKEYNSYTECEVKKGIYPEYKSRGMAYIRFAREEKQLFRLLFMGDKKAVSSTDELFDNEVVRLTENLKLTNDKARLFHLEMWIFVHGIASMMVSESIDLEEDLISGMLSDIYKGLTAGIE